LGPFLVGWISDAAEASYGDRSLAFSLGVCLIALVMSFVCYWIAANAVSQQEKETKTWPTTQSRRVFCVVPDICACRRGGEKRDQNFRCRATKKSWRITGFHTWSRSGFG